MKITMTIDKFGRHIHKHVIKRHLMEEDVVGELMKHPKFKEKVQAYPQKTPPLVSTPSKYIITLYSSGFIGVTGAYHINPQAKQNFLYKNKLYSGKVIHVVYSNEVLAKLQIDSKVFDPKTPVLLKDGTVFRLKYIGSKPYPKETEPVSAEVVIEGDVIN